MLTLILGVLVGRAVGTVCVNNDGTNSMFSDGFRVNIYKNRKKAANQVAVRRKTSDDLDKKLITEPIRIDPHNIILQIHPN